MSGTPTKTARDTRMEAALAMVLNGGTMLAGAVVATGVVLHLRTHHAERIAFSEFGSGQREWISLPRVLEGAGRFEPAAVIQLGVLLLVLTPAARVLFTLIVFIARRDWLYIAVATIVLGALMYGFAGGRV